MDAKTTAKPKRKIWIGLASLGGDIKLATMKALIYNVMPLVVARNWEIRLFDEVGHCDIYLLRAQIVANFLHDPDATDLVFVDNDVAWADYGLINLLDHDVDVVAGAYPKREEPIQFPFRCDYKDGKPHLFGDPGTGLVEVLGLPGGFMRIKRHVLEKMVAHYAEDLLCVDPMVPQGESVRIFNPYYVIDENGRRHQFSEDYAFCQRWRDMGGKVFVDVSIPMAHVGTKAYQGCFGAWLEQNSEPEEQEQAA